MEPTGYILSTTIPVEQGASPFVRIVPDISIVFLVGAVVNGQ
jgi:hypothetical protein